MGTSDGRFAGSGRSLGRSALLLTLVALLVCAVGVAAGAERADVPAPGPGGRSAPLSPHPADRGDQLVVLFGDSLSTMAAPEALVRFVADPDLRLSANAFGGTQLDTPAWVERYPSVEDGAIVLLFLGTNDISVDSLAEAEADARDAIDAVTRAGAHRVVVATVNTTGRPPGFGEDWTARARAFNDWLRRADADLFRYPRLQLVDWDMLSRGRTDWLAPDGFHHSEAGRAAYAEATQATARAAAGLGPLPPPPPPEPPPAGRMPTTG